MFTLKTRILERGPMIACGTHKLFFCACRELNQTREVVERLFRCHSGTGQGQCFMNLRTYICDFLACRYYGFLSCMRPILSSELMLLLLQTRYGGTTSSTATALITAVITNRLSVSYGPLTGGTWTRLPRDL